MTSFEDSLLGISAPFGEGFQKVTSSRYYWDNEQRSDEQFVIIQRTISGQGIFSWEGGRWSVPPEHAFLAVVPEKSSYHYPDAAAGPWTFSWVNFYGPLAALLGRGLRTLHGPVLPLPKRSAACAAFDSITAKAERRVVSDPHDISVDCYTFLVEWARQLYHPKESHPVETVMNICRVRYRESLGIKELADEAGLSREHLTRIFTAQTGLSPARYLRGLRVDAAREMLKNGASSLKETALRCGFSSVRVLNRALAEVQSSPRPGAESAIRKAKAIPPPASPGKPPRSRR